AVSPLAEVAYERPDAACSRLYASYAKTTQVPTYTALNSSATAGLFRGNPDLGRSASHNLELGARGTWLGWEHEAAVFFRRDDRLVDWTFRRGVTARTANAVDIDSTGVEFFARRTFGRVDLIFGYAWLHKDADYGAAMIDASFYALNFPKHRLTAATVVRLGRGFELRMDNEARLQEDNLLRTTGGDETVISSAGLYWRVPSVRGLQLSLQVDNLWNSNFQEVPAVPAGNRLTTAGVAYAW
ncbi:MAG TPA: TonB-dependent receptor, partial [Opitutaceae bacterium]